MKAIIKPVNIIENRILLERQLIEKHPDITKYQIAEFFYAAPAVISKDLKNIGLGNFFDKQKAGIEKFDILSEIEKRDKELKKALKESTYKDKTLAEYGLWREPRKYGQSDRVNNLCKMGFSFEDAFRYIKRLSEINNENAYELSKADRAHIRISLGRAGHFSIDKDKEVRTYILKRLRYGVDLHDLYLLTGASSSYIDNGTEPKSTKTQIQSQEKANKAYALWRQGKTQEEVAAELGVSRMTVSSMIASVTAGEGDKSHKTDSDKRIKNVDKRDAYVISCVVNDIKANGVPVTIDEVSQRTGINKRYVSRLLNYLEKNKIIK